MERLTSKVTQQMRHHASCWLVATRIALSLLAFILFCIGIGTSFWVELNDETEHWGLFQHCFVPNIIYINHEECVYLDPGEMSGYFEAARTLNCFVIVCGVVCLFVTYMMVHRGHRPQEAKTWHVFYFISAFATVLLTAFYLIPFIELYKDDPTWKDKGASIGYSVPVTVGAAVLMLISIFFNCAFCKKAYQNIEMGNPCRYRCLKKPQDPETDGDAGWKRKTSRVSSSSVAPLDLPPTKTSEIQDSGTPLDDTKKSKETPKQRNENWYPHLWPRILYEEHAPEVAHHNLPPPPTVHHVRKGDTNIQVFSVLQDMKGTQLSPVTEDNMAPVISARTASRPPRR